MTLIRERHQRTKEEIKDLFIALLNQNGLDSSIHWDDYAFLGKQYGTKVQGEIFDDEIHIEIQGWFEKQAAHELRKSWKELVMKGLV